MRRQCTIRDHPDFRGLALKFGLEATRIEPTDSHDVAGRQF